MKKLLTLACTLALPFNSYSQITVDGSLTNSGAVNLNLNGNTYTIGESLGAVRR